jgi:anthranilate synthase component 2
MSKDRLGPSILVLDNYDSFTFNLVQYLGELGARIEVKRNDEITAAEMKRHPPDGLLVSPGPGTPQQAGVSVAAIRALDGRCPILGVCLGHQALAFAFGGSVVQAAHILHGKTSEILHAGRGIFAGLDNPFSATRYHSLAVPRAGLPEIFQVVAWTADDEVMGLHKRGTRSWGVQFHPESILSQGGKQLLRNWLSLCAE